MSIIWAIGFNENDSSNVRDYSESDKDATTVIDLSVVVDSINDGFYGEGNGSTTDIQVTIGGGIAYSEPFSVFARFRVDSGAGDGYIYWRENHSYLLYDSVAGTVEGGVWDSGGGLWINTTKSVSVTTWYKVLLTYSDTNKSRLYLDSSVSPDTDATDGSPQDTDPVKVFTNGTDYFDGRIAELIIYNTEITTGQTLSLMATLQGFQLTMRNHGFSLGDMLTNFTDAAPEITVFLVLDSDTIRYRSSNDNPVRSNERFIKVGNRFNTTRQHFVMSQGTTSPPRIGVYDEISKFSDVGVESKQVAVYDKDGFRRKGNPTRITADSTINSQDRWVPYDVSGGGVTTNLPASPKDWEEHTFVDAEGSCNAGVNLITLDGNGNNINGAATATLQNARASKSVIYDTTEWIIYQEQ